MRKYHYYEVLEISREATQEDISTAFRRLARVWHPDLNPGSQEAETTFRRINSAYQVLVNEKTRALEVDKRTQLTRRQRLFQRRAQRLAQQQQELGRIAKDFADALEADNTQEQMAPP